MAARVLLLLPPITALRLLENQNREACACAGALLALSVWLRWKDRDGIKSVAHGLVGGGTPLALARVFDGAS